ncbi:MAG: TonB-dependent receptor, partial [Bacteroidales bacterium]|nr:TonB-dependent receptor [Bacteroidales bacterium]
MKTAVFYIALLFSLSVEGQITSGLNDTVLIKGVVISGRAKDAALAGFKKIKLDSLDIKECLTSSVADILSVNTTIFVKSFGPGTSSTSSSRGTGANHTLIAWNGIKINNPMLGQSDLSLLPSGLMDEVHIYQGGGSMELQSGGLGSAVNLLTMPEWNRKTNVSIGTSAGTYGRLNLLAKLSTGSKNFHSITRLFSAYSKNNFLYSDPYTVSEKNWLRRENSQMRQNVFIQELYFRKPQHQFSAKLWYQKADRNIPVPVIVSQLRPGEKQTDESVRALFNYDYYPGAENLNLCLAILSDRLDYSNPPASIDSRNKMITGVFKGSLTAPLTVKTKAKIQIENNLNAVKSNNYETQKINNILEIAFIAETFFSERINTSVLLREIVTNKKMLIPDFSAGIQLKTDNKNASFLKANFSRNSRIPSLNDMFWLPGGNPDLKNEYGTTLEIGWETSGKKFSYLSYNFDITLFRSFIRE